MSALFLDAIRCKNVGQKTPVWLMRQAGRYMTEYQALRKRYSFMQLIHDPELIVSITQLPITAFGFDAAIVFSDILLLTELLGCHLWFEETSGPHIEPVISGPKDLERILGRTIEAPFLTEAICSLKQALAVPLIGFAGAPFTVASYMIEGKSSTKLSKTKKWMLEDPESFHRFLDILADYTIELLKLQIRAGVDAVQLFDTWAEKLGFGQFMEFSARYLKKIRDAIDEVPVVLFCKGSSAFTSALARIQPAGISLDWQADLVETRMRVGPHIALQGNLDPDILLTNPETVRREVLRLVRSMKSDPGYIFNLGHGILPDTPRENVEALVECLRS